MSSSLDRLKSALQDRYAIEREIGRGGMATVYLARDLKHRREVAIKVLHSEVAAVTGADRFLREVEIAAGLQHPHVLTLIDSGEAGGLLYYVMPFVPGETLRGRLAREGELPVDEAVRIFREIVDALGHAHQHGLVHRDVKPDNVLFSGGHAVVTDFGIARAVGDAAGEAQLTTAGMALGTPTYMAPEQAVADPNVDHRSDLYAAGVVAYEMLTGRPPFTGTSPGQILAAHVTGTPEPLERQRESVPASLAAIVMRCLEKRPADRWQSAAELLREIDAVTTPTLGTMPVTATAAPPGRPLSRVLAWGALGFAAVVAVVAIVLRPSESSVPTDPDRLVVVPFTPAVEDPELARLGREMVVLLSTGLDGVGDLSTVLGSSVLAQAPDRQYTLDEGIELARSFGAGTAIHASLLREGDRVRAEGVIATVDGGAERRFTVSGPLSDKAALADSVSWAVLRELWEEGEPPSPRVAEKVGTSSLEALGAFLEGERAFVENRFVDAADAYERAFNADSTFWMAYRQYERSQSWFIRSTPAWIVEAYSEHRDELPEAERRLLEADELPMPQQIQRLREITMDFPDYWPAVFQYADRLVHYGPVQAGTGVHDARAAWDRTLELNPRLLPAWHHLWWTHMLAGDSARAFTLLDTVAAMDGGPVLEASMGYDLLEEMGLITQARFHGTWDLAAFDTLTSEVARTRTNLGFYHGLAAGWNGYFGAPEFQVAWNREVARKTTLVGVADDYAVATAFAWAGRGAWDSAMAAARVPAEGGVADARINAYRLGVLGAWLGAVEPAAADAWRAGAEADVGDDVGRRQDLAWLDGILAAARRDDAGLERARATLAADTGVTGGFLARSLGAFGADLRGDRATATDELLALVRDVQAVGRWGAENPLVNPVHRLSVGRWLVERGDLAVADSLLRWHEGASFLGGEDGWAINAARPVFYLERARLAGARGRGDEAAWLYREFLRRYDLPGEAGRDLVTEAERALARRAET